mmetsp:Transcript_13936/g.58164  ORF Transcript_13936/g.58164 Transcript_13936/m.58164 type:complete len:589 (+) Transcript_13936:2135-3901(+)
MAHTACLANDSAGGTAGERRWPRRRSWGSTVLNECEHFLALDHGGIRARGLPCRGPVDGCIVFYAHTVAVRRRRGQVVHDFLLDLDTIDVFTLTRDCLVRGRLGIRRRLRAWDRRSQLLLRRKRSQHLDERRQRYLLLRDDTLDRLRLLAWGPRARRTICAVPDTVATPAVALRNLLRLFPSTIDVVVDFLATAQTARGRLALQRSGDPGIDRGGRLAKSPAAVAIGLPSSIRPRTAIACARAGRSGCRGSRSGFGLCFLQLLCHALGFKQLHRGRRSSRDRLLAEHRHAVVVIEVRHCASAIASHRRAVVRPCRCSARSKATQQSQLAAAQRVRLPEASVSRENDPTAACPRRRKLRLTSEHKVGVAAPPVTDPHARLPLWRRWHPLGQRRRWRLAKQSLAGRRGQARAFRRTGAGRPLARWWQGGRRDGGPRVFLCRHERGPEATKASPVRRVVNLDDAHGLLSALDRPALGKSLHLHALVDQCADLGAPAAPHGDAPHRGVGIRARHSRRRRRRAAAFINRHEIARRSRTCIRRRRHRRRRLWQRCEGEGELLSSRLLRLAQPVCDHHLGEYQPPPRAVDQRRTQ